MSKCRNEMNNRLTSTEIIYIIITLYNYITKCCHRKEMSHQYTGFLKC